jgi:hypothetical protein
LARSDFILVFFQFEHAFLFFDSSPDRSVTGKLLSALQKFGTTLNDYMHLFLPPIVRLFDSPEVPMQVRLFFSKIQTWFSI